MESKIVKSKFYCKNSMSSSPRLSEGSNWAEKFISSKWYDGEYETWNFKDGFKLNGGHNRYWVINEQGEKEELSKSHMNVLFDLTINFRNYKIEEILK